MILDVASGTAGVALQLAARNAGEHGRAQVLGVDLTEPMLRQGRRRGLRLASGTGSAWPSGGPSGCPSPTPASTR